MCNIIYVCVCMYSSNKSSGSLFLFWWFLTNRNTLCLSFMQEQLLKQIEPSPKRKGKKRKNERNKKEYRGKKEKDIYLNLKFKKCEAKEIKTHLCHSRRCSVIITFVSTFPQVIFCVLDAWDTNDVSPGRKSSGQVIGDIYDANGDE